MVKYIVEGKTPHSIELYDYSDFEKVAYYITSIGEMGKTPNPEVSKRIYIVCPQEYIDKCGGNSRDAYNWMIDDEPDILAESMMDDADIRAVMAIRSNAWKRNYDVYCEAFEFLLSKSINSNGAYTESYNKVSLFDSQSDTFDNTVKPGSMVTVNGLIWDIPGNIYNKLSVRDFEILSNNKPNAKNYVWRKYSNYIDSVEDYLDNDTRVDIYNIKKFFYDLEKYVGLPTEIKFVIPENLGGCDVDSLEIDPASAYIDKMVDNLEDKYGGQIIAFSVNGAPLQYHDYDERYR